MRRFASLAGIAGLVFAFATSLASPAGASGSVTASGSQSGGPSNPYSPAYGHPYRHGVVPTTGQQQQMNNWSKQNNAAAPANANTLLYGGGVDGIGVTSGTPKVYLVFWGSQWGTQGTDGSGNLTFSNDPQSGAPYIQKLFKGLGTGGELWSGTMTQYCDGPLVSMGASSCPAGAQQVGYPTGGAYAGVWYDNSSAEPTAATAHQIAAEAVAAAGHFGNTTAALNRYAQYDILSPTGLNPDTYKTAGFCAWHDYNGDTTLDGGGAVSSPYGDVAFTNMPYVMDEGAGCGQGYVNSPGILDGYSVVNGHEYGETITDQNPAGGWLSNSGNEIGDECAWNGIDGDVRTSTGSFAMQSMWSNLDNACEMSHTVVTNSGDFSISDNPGSGTVAAASSIKVTVSTAVTITPAEPVALSVTGLPSGAVGAFSPTSVTAGGSSTLTITPQGTTPSGTYPLTITGTAADSAVHSVGYSVTVTNLPASASIASTLPGPRPGSPQSAIVGSSYTNPLAVTVLDGSSAPVQGADVTFTAPSSGPSVTFAAPCSAKTCMVVTDASGTATVPTATANTTPGAFAVTTSIPGLSSSPSFTLTNLVGPASRMLPVSGSGQNANVGAHYASLVEVRVTDTYGNPVSGSTVSFQAPPSGPSVTFAACSSSCTTDSNGDATSPAMTANTVAGTFDVTASLSGTPGQSFTLTNLAGPASTATVENGSGQSTLVDNAFASPLSLTVTDAYGNPVSGVPVTFTAPASDPTATFASCPGGNATPNQCVVATDGNGNATSSALTAGDNSGSYDVTATPAGVASVNFALTDNQSGYYLVGSDGSVYPHGGAPDYGSTRGVHLNKPIVGVAAVPGGNGYYLVASDGGIFNFGPGAVFHGSTGAVNLNKPIVGMAVDPATGGYWLVASDGGIFNFGGAPFWGSLGAIHLNKPIIGMAPTAQGGYYLVASDGGVFEFGPGATFYGSTGAVHLNQPIVGMALANGGGYYLVASDGGIFNFGPGAVFHGSTGAVHLNSPIIGMAVNPADGGYWLGAADGGIFQFATPFYGSEGGTALPAPIVRMTSSA